jgi:hypothetical protein
MQDRSFRPRDVRSVSHGLRLHLQSVPMRELSAQGDCRADGAEGVPGDAEGKVKLFRTIFDAVCFPWGWPTFRERKELKSENEDWQELALNEFENSDERQRQINAACEVIARLQDQLDRQEKMFA